MSLGVLTLCFQSQVLQQELHQVKQDLFVSQQAFAQAQEEQRQTDKEVRHLCCHANALGLQVDSGRQLTQPGVFAVRLKSCASSCVSSQVPILKTVRRTSYMNWANCWTERRVELP